MSKRVLEQDGETFVSRDVIVRWREKDPFITVDKMATKLGISYERVRQLLAKEDLPVTPPTRKEA